MIPINLPWLVVVGTFALLLGVGFAFGWFCRKEYVG
jgi:hypothetical protein